VEEELDALEARHLALRPGRRFRLKELYALEVWAAKTNREKSELGIAFRARVDGRQYPHLRVLGIDGRNHVVYERI
jgi:hypothetical protein